MRLSYASYLPNAFVPPFFLNLTLSFSSGQLYWSRNPSQLNQAEQNRTWQFHLWNRGLLWLQSWLLPVRVVRAYLPAYRLLGQALTRVHRWVNSFDIFVYIFFFSSLSCLFFHPLSICGARLDPRLGLLSFSDPSAESLSFHTQWGSC